MSNIVDISNKLSSEVINRQNSLLIHIFNAFVSVPTFITWFSLDMSCTNLAEKRSSHQSLPIYLKKSYYQGDSNQNILSVDIYRKSKHLLVIYFSENQRLKRYNYKFA